MSAECGQSCHACAWRINPRILYLQRRGGCLLKLGPPPRLCVFHRAELMNIPTQPSPGITLLGLGPGDPDLLTRQAWRILESSTEVYLRTRQHPTVAGFPPHLEIYSFDDLYETAQSFESVYNQIVEQVLVLGRRPQGVIYAVPGHPFVAEATGPEIARRARQEGLPLRIVEGLSFLEPVYSALGLDPYPHTALVDALELAAAHVPPFPPSSPAIIAQLHSPGRSCGRQADLDGAIPRRPPCTACACCRYSPGSGGIAGIV